MQTLAGLDLSWQLGILAAELGTDRAGRLLEPAGVLTGDQEDAVGRLRASLPEAGSGAEPEAGIAAMLRGLSAPMLEGPNRGFLRPESTLHVVIFSDSDDHSEVWLDDPLQAALDKRRAWG